MTRELTAATEHAGIRLDAFLSRRRRADLFPGRPPDRRGPRPCQRQTRRQKRPPLRR